MTAPRPDALDADEARLVAEHLAVRGVTRCPPGVCALEDGQIAPGMTPGGISRGGNREWYMQRERASRWAHQRCDWRINQHARAALGWADAAAFVQGAVKPRWGRT
jgi:hypothetical protein